MPRRTWRAVSEDSLIKQLLHYPCPTTCSVRERMIELLSVATSDLDVERRTNGEELPADKQMVDGLSMRALIVKMIQAVATASENGKLSHYPHSHALASRDVASFAGYMLGAICDLCFNFEYVRRIKDKNWSYCNKHETPRAYYPYLGVCPYCITKADRPQEAALGQIGRQSSGRYFGNKIESHHVGRIGERAIVYILDLLAKFGDPESTSYLIFDDQHDVDALFTSGENGILAQIKASPLILLPIAVDLSASLPGTIDEKTGVKGLPDNHTFCDIDISEHNLCLYIPWSSSQMPLGPKKGPNWPYQPFLSTATDDDLLSIIENWIDVYSAFHTPKRLRSGDDIKKAWLTAGWGAPIDDNKAKAGLARSDNMMKGAYAVLKYGAYYKRSCIRKSIRTALVSNIDPAHQYDEYLKELESLRWGDHKDFIVNDVKYTIDINHTHYLFDAVFCFNRQIINDDHVKATWDLEGFGKALLENDMQRVFENWLGTE